MNDLEKSAGRALWLSIAAVLTCCGPLGVIAVVWGFVIKRDADAVSAPTPLRAFFAIGLGTLSVIQLSYAVYTSQKNEKARMEMAGAATKRLAGQREALALKHDVACDLTIEYLLASKKRSFDAITCPGQVEAKESVATLTEVVAKNGSSEQALRACFGRTSRWFVIDADANLRCPEALPAGLSAAGPTSLPSGLSALVSEDDRWRLAVAEATTKENVERFTSELARLRSALAAHKHAERACPSFGLGMTDAGAKRRLEIGYVDFDDLNASTKKTADEWEFLTKASLRAALNPQNSFRGADINRVGRYLAVFDAETRAWPEMTKEDGVIKDKFAYVSGAFDGWMTLVDLEQAKVLCETRFRFESSENIRYRKGKFSSEEGSVEKALKSDFEDRFEDAAIAAVNKLANGEIKLGVKLLE
ncbi:MAG: hypothetical protein IT381_29615 [Deltaproteobacteria bacterium]|nr:hypothetical protein [Deltaproteobacteria bacterium]